MALHVERVVEILDFLLQFAGDFEAFDGRVFFGGIRGVLRCGLDWCLVGQLDVLFERLRVILHKLGGGYLLRFGCAALHDILFYGKREER